jgi:Xanthomonas XOO_2897-like deaminase
MLATLPFDAPVAFELGELLMGGRAVIATGEAVAGRAVASSAFQQIEFGADMSSWAATLRYTRRNFNPSGNVAVFEYLDEAGNLQYAMGFAERTVGHAEQVVGKELMEMGIDPSRVTRIYTEFAPCTGPSNCFRYLQQRFPGAKVLYSFPHDDAGRAMKAALFLRLLE